MCLTPRPLLQRGSKVIRTLFIDDTSYYFKSPSLPSLKERGRG